ncbi:structural protein P5 [Pseudoalteromonas sp. SW0106-04]|uniref:virion protein n=1 Tax=Pseudoalteromonas sp. SW0106-04 TaxID=1702169 RepID=UPI0006BF0B0F|nr:virion protein [Pseudoalteromonas sp. SW0106-04]GAP76759.1 structural protein P5 [Pseudoalteromonas sp. SW0106-04]
MAQAKGLRNNNPLNIKYSGDKWQGMTGTDGPFVVFETPKHGLRAAGRILRTYAHTHQLRDIEGIVSRWAPPSENDTQNYIEFVTTKTGLPRNQALDRDTYPQVLAAMIHMENGSQPFSLDEIRQGFEWGFYG